MVLPADNGRSTVIRDKSEYHDKSKTLLSDEKSYKHIKKDHTNKYANNFVEDIKRIRDSGISHKSSKEGYIPP